MVGEGGYVKTKFWHKKIKYHQVPILYTSPELKLLRIYQNNRKKIEFSHDIYGKILTVF